MLASNFECSCKEQVCMSVCTAPNKGSETEAGTIHGTVGVLGLWWGAAGLGLIVIQLFWAPSGHAQTLERVLFCPQILGLLGQEVFSGVFRFH